MTIVIDQYLNLQMEMKQMSIKMNKNAYIKLIQEDIDWLMKQPRTLEREHIYQVLKQSSDRIYNDEVDEPLDEDAVIFNRGNCGQN